MIIPGQPLDDRDDDLETPQEPNPQSAQVYRPGQQPQEPQQPLVQPQQPAPLLLPPPQAPAPRRSILDIEKQLHGEAISSAFAYALETTPDAYADAAKIAKAMGRDEDPKIFVKDLDVARAFLQQQQLKEDKFTTQFPHLAKAMENAKFVSLVRDDLGNLQTTEGSWDWVGRSWDVARGTSRLGTIGVTALFEGRDFTPYERRERRRIQDLAIAHAEREPNWVASGIGLAGSFLDTLVTGAAVGTAVGATPAAPAAPFIAGAAMFAQSWRLEAGNLYGQLIDAGYTPADAAQTAAVFGTAIAAVDLVGAKVAGKAVRKTIVEALPKLLARGLPQETRTAALVEAIKANLKGIVYEPATEGVQDIIGMAGEETLRRRFKLDAPSAMRPMQALDTTWETFKGMVVLGGLGGGGAAIVNLRKAADAEHTARAFQALGKVEEESKLNARSPEERAKFVQQNANSAELGTVYVRADKLLETVDQLEKSQAKDEGRATWSDQLETSLPGVLQQARAAAPRKGNVEIKSGDFMTHLGRNDLGRALMQHATFHQGGKTPFEGAAIKERAQEFYADAEKAIKEGGEKAVRTLTEIREIGQEIRANLRAAGEVPELAELHAKMSEAMIFALAESEGKSPRQFWDEQGFGVEQGQLTGALDVFSQFFGVKSQMDTARQLGFEKAVKMRNEGASVEEVRKATGWILGAEGKLRYEVSDKQAEYLGPEAANVPVSVPGTPGMVLPLSQVFRHPALAAAYPQLGKVPVHLVNIPELDWRGLATHDAIYLNLAQAPTREQLRKTTLHEVQHLIQRIENFARGGSQGEFTQDELNRINEQDFERVLREIQAKDPEAVEFYKDLRRATKEFTDLTTNPAATGEQIAAAARKYDALVQLVGKSVGASRLARAGAAQISSFEAYRRLAGEAESRNVEARADFTEQELFDTPPALTMDIAEEKLILKFHSASGSFKQLAGLSTRIPTAKSATQSGHLELLSIDYKTALSATDAVEKNAALLRNYTGMPAVPEDATAEQVVEAYVKHVADNLVWLHDLMPAEARERARLWYDGGRKTIAFWSKRYGVSELQVAAVIAVLSPQNDWFMNMSQTERILDMFFASRDEAWSPSQDIWADRMASIAARAVVGLEARIKRLRALEDAVLADTAKIEAETTRESAKRIAALSRDEQKKLAKVTKQRLATVTSGLEAKLEQIDRAAARKRASKKFAAGEITEEQVAAETESAKAAARADFATQADEARARVTAQVKEQFDAYRAALPAEAREAAIETLMSRVVDKAEEDAAKKKGDPRAKRRRSERTLQNRLNDLEELGAVRGKTLGQLLDAGKVTTAARWIRSRDESGHNDRHFKVLTPEGGVGDWQMTKDQDEDAAGDSDELQIGGEEDKTGRATMMWKSYSTITKALRILLDGSADNITQMLGDEHKVRNFFNNLFDPSSPLWTTIDTHAKAAALLRMLGAQSPEVSQTFGSKGAASSGVTGINGLYPYELEAYTRAAQQVSERDKTTLLPREMQSITWEAIRGIFTAVLKRNPALVKQVDALWDAFKAGTKTIAEVRTEIVQLITAKKEGQELWPGGMTPPAWASTPRTDQPGSTYQGETRTAMETKASKRPALPAGKKPSAIVFEVAPNPDNLVETTRWKTLSLEEQRKVTHTVVGKIMQQVADEFGVEFTLEEAVGGFEGGTNIAMMMEIDRPELAIPIAKELGRILRQKQMVVASPVPAQGLDTNPAIHIGLPDGYGPQQVKRLYDAMWASVKGPDGKPLVGGLTVKNGVMEILDFSGLGPGILVNLIRDAMVSYPDPLTFHEGVAHSALLDVEQDAQPTTGRPAAAEPAQRELDVRGADEADRRPEGGGDVAPGDTRVPPEVGARPRPRLDRIRAEATAAFEAAIAGVEQQRAGGAGGAARGVALQQLARGEFSPELRKILLNKDANASTFVHELVHWNIEQMARIAALGRMQGARVARDFRILLDWAGFSGTVQEWRALSIEERKPVHEKIARGFEVYMFEGKAPSKQMRGVFERLSRLIREAYRKIIGEINAEYRAEFGEDLPGLTDEVRHVFGRMLTSEDAIRQLRAAEDAAGIFQTKEEFVKAGNDPEKWDELQQSMQDEENAAIDKLTAERMAEIGWESNARTKLLQDAQRQHNDVRKVVRAEAAQEVDLQPISRARQWLKTGKMIDETGKETRDDSEGEHKLSREIVSAMLAPGVPEEDLLATELLPDESTKSLSALPPAKQVAALRPFLKKDGVNPNDVAQSLGYETGEQLVQDLLTQPSREELIDTLTDDRMLNEFSELTDPDLVEEGVRSALHNEARRRTVAMELRALEKSETSDLIMLGGAEEAARQAIANRPIGQITVREFSIAAGRARADAKEAFKKGDLQAAKAAKRAEMLNDALAVEAGKARAEVRAELKQFGKAFRSDKRLATTRDINVIGVIRAILSLYGLGRGDKTAAEHLEPVKEYDPTTFANLVPAVNDATEAAAQLPDVEDRYEHMTLDQFRDLAAQVKLLWQQSRLMRQVMLDGRTMAADAAVAQAVDALKKLPPQAPLGAKGAVTGFERLKGWVADYAANLRRVEHLFRQLDGGNTDGIFSKLYRRVKRAGDTFRKELREYTRRYESMLKQLDFTGPHKIVAWELGGNARTRTGGYLFGRGALHGKAEVIGFMLHFLGNRSNRDKLIGAREPEGWTEEGGWAFLDRMMNQGVLTKKDFDFVQGVYDLNEELKPKLFQAHFDMTGYRPEPVEAQEFTNRFGTYRGGYVPATPDRDIVAAVETHEMDQRAEFMKSVPIVPRGMTISRIEKYQRQLAMNPLTQAEHMSRVLRYVHMAPAIRDVRRVLDNREVSDRIERDIGKTTKSSVINPWLRNSSLQMVGMPPDSPMEKVVDWLRRSANMNTMFLNLGNALQNFTGLFAIMREVSPRYVLGALGRWAASFGKSAEAVAARSTHMKNRLEEQVFDIKTQLRNQIANPGLVRRGARWVSNHTYVLQQFTQNFVDVIAADASYHQEYAKQKAAGATDEVADRKAVDVSDSLVRRTQMAGDPEDVSRFESGGAIMRALLPFKSWFINWANHQFTSVKTSEKAADIVATYVYGVMLPSVMAAVISEFAAGRLADDDDNGWGDEAVQLWWKSQLDTALGALPGFGDVVKAGVNIFYDDNVWNDRMPAPPFAQMLQRVLQETAQIKRDIEKTGAPASGNVIDALVVLGELTGVPTRALGSRAKYLAETTPEPTFEYIRGAVTGRAPPR